MLHIQEKCITFINTEQHFHNIWQSVCESWSIWHIRAQILIHTNIFLYMDVDVSLYVHINMYLCINNFLVSRKTLIHWTVYTYRCMYVSTYLPLLAWDASLRKGTWGYWWMRSSPWATSMHLQPRDPTVSWAALREA